jgi:hypothetical protein
MVFNAAMKVVTELGEERRCMSCGEFWPADTEFFDFKMSSRDGLSMRCIACIRARVWQLHRPRRAVDESGTEFGA